MDNLISVSIEVFPEDEPRFTLWANDVTMPDPICDEADLANAQIAFGRFLSILAADAREAAEEDEGGD